MARGNLYSVHEFDMSNEFLAYLKAKEKHGDDSEGFRTELAEALADSLDGWDLDDYLTDMHEDQAVIAKELGFEYMADDVVCDIRSEVEYLQDIEEWQEEFTSMIKNYGGEAIRFEDSVIFRMSQTAVENWFKNQFEQFKKLAENISLHDFCECDPVWNLKNAISIRWNDAMLLHGDFRLMDDGIRKMERNEWYIASNAMLMH